MAEVVLSSRSFAVVELLHLYDDYVILFLLFLEDFLMEAESHGRLLEGWCYGFHLLPYTKRHDAQEEEVRDCFGEIYVVVYSFLHARDTLLKGSGGRVGMDMRR
jgi:hypothetical protein